MTNPWIIHELIIAPKSIVCHFYGLSMLSNVGETSNIILLPQWESRQVSIHVNVSEIFQFLSKLWSQYIMHGSWKISQRINNGFLKGKKVFGVLEKVQFLVFQIRSISTQLTLKQFIISEHWAFYFFKQTRQVSRYPLLLYMICFIYFSQFKISDTGRS